MRNIIIGFSTGHTLFSFLIRAFEGFTPYSHVFIKFRSDSLDRDLIYQASGLQVNFVSPVIFNSKAKIIREFVIEVCDDSHKKAVQFAIDNAGVPYGYKQLLGMAWVRLAKIFGKTVKNPLSDGKATYVCSELAGTLLNQALGDKAKLDLESAGPKELYNHLESITST